MTKQNTIPITNFSKNCLTIAIKSGWQLVGEKNGIFSLVVNANDPAQVIEGPNQAKKLRVLTIDSKMSGMEFFILSEIGAAGMEFFIKSGIGAEREKAFLENLMSPLTQNTDEFSAKSGKLINEANKMMIEGDFVGAGRYLDMATAPRADLTRKVQAGIKQLNQIAPRTIEETITKQIKNNVALASKTTKRADKALEKTL